MVCFCACGTPKAQKSVLQLFADQSLETELSLVGDKFLVADGKGYDLNSSFDSAAQLSEMILSGKSCDLLIISSEFLLEQLEKAGIISADKTLSLLDRPMAMIAADTDIPLSPEDFFSTEETEEDFDEEDSEEYRLYLDALREKIDEEDWQDDWEDNYSGLWIQEQIPLIGVPDRESREGQCARAVLNQYNEAYDLLDQIGQIRTFDTEADLSEAILNGEIDAGVWPTTSLLDGKGLHTVKMFDQASDPMITYYVCLIDGSENRKEAKELMAFLKGDHAKRFFEDFGFIMRE